MSLYDAPSRDYGSSADDVAGGTNQPRGSLCSCCSTVIRGNADRRYTVAGIAQMRHQDSILAGQVGRRGPVWKSAVTIDQPQRIIQVRTDLGAVNATGRTSHYPGTQAISNDRLNAELAAIKGAIERAWNKPYTMVIVDDKCGEQRFVVQFVANLRVVSGTWGHYTIDFINVPGTNNALVDRGGIASWRSWVQQEAFRAKFNLADARSASSFGSNRGDTLEPHEYGHMLGLWDEYVEFRDYNQDGDGTDRVNVNGVTRWEIDRGGVKYDYPNGADEFARANGELMASMRHRRARPARYSISVQFAVKEILEAQGRRISNIYTVGQPGR